MTKAECSSINSCWQMPAGTTMRTFFAPTATTRHRYDEPWRSRCTPARADSGGNHEVEELARTGTRWRVVGRRISTKRTTVGNHHGAGAGTQWNGARQGPREERRADRGGGDHARHGLG